MSRSCIVPLLLVDFGTIAILHAVGLGFRLAYIGFVALIEAVLPDLEVSAVAASGSTVLDLFFE